jgi:hypothetical protein
LTRTFEVDSRPLDGSVVKAATILPIRRYRHLPGFLRANSAIVRELKGSPGLVRFAVRAHLIQRRFYTLSVWRDRPSIVRFVRSPPHARAMGQFEHWRDSGAKFVDWPSPDARLDWTEGLRRLAEAPSLDDYHVQA